MRKLALILSLLLVIPGALAVNCDETKGEYATTLQGRLTDWDHNQITGEKIFIINNDIIYVDVLDGVFAQDICITSDTEVVNVKIRDKDEKGQDYVSDLGDIPLTYTPKAITAKTADTLTGGLSWDTITGKLFDIRANSVYGKLLRAVTDGNLNGILFYSGLEKADSLIIYHHGDSDEWRFKPSGAPLVFGWGEREVFRVDSKGAKVTGDLEVTGDLKVGGSGVGNEKNFYMWTKRISDETSRVTLTTSSEWDQCWLGGQKVVKGDKAVCWIVPEGMTDGKKTVIGGQRTKWTYRIEFDENSGQHDEVECRFVCMNTE